MDNGIAWELMNNGGETPPKAPNPKGEGFRKVTTWIIKITGWLFLGAFLLWLPYTLFVHPLDKLKVKLFFSNSYEMEMKATVHYDFGYDKGVWVQKVRSVKVDGDLVCIYNRSIGNTYYKVVGKTVYEYWQDENGEWKAKKSDKNIFSTGGSSGTGVTFSTLLDRRNYEKVKGELGLYRMKGSVDIGDFDRIELQRSNAGYEIKAYSGSNYVIITFGYFGVTQITPPWEEE